MYTWKCIVPSYISCGILYIILLLVNLGTTSVLSDSLYHTLHNKYLHVNQYEEEYGSFPLLMPHVRPYRAELYLCTPVKIDSSTSYYIVGFEPKAQMNTAHHILLYGCEKPGLRKPVWNCGEMASKESEETASPCGSRAHSQILYAWARDAPKLELPEDVGFKVGDGTPVRYMVLQVHYASIDKFKDGSSDNSGVIIDYTKKPLNNSAGVLLLGTGGVIPPMATEKMETACEITEKKTIYPFAFRTHTHSLGKLVSGYRVRPDENGNDVWTLIGQRDPLTPQMFYPVQNAEPIRYGDYVAARCTMQSNRQRLTEIGPTKEHEMCNLYLMYYVKNDEPLSMKYCFSQGPPNYYWKNADTGLNNIPN